MTDWADKKIEELDAFWMSDESGATWNDLCAQALRQARAEGMRMAAEIADRLPRGASIAQEIRAAADKEGTS